MSTPSRHLGYYNADSEIHPIRIANQGSDLGDAELANLKRIAGDNIADDVFVGPFWLLDAMHIISTSPKAKDDLDKMNDKLLATLENSQIPVWGNRTMQVSPKLISRAKGKADKAIELCVGKCFYTMVHTTDKYKARMLSSIGATVNSLAYETRKPRRFDDMLRSIDVAVDKISNPEIRELSDQLMIWSRLYRAYMSICNKNFRVLE